ncbi:hypothetical protein LG197_07940 [Pseudomonas asiatica]|uniref:hypothetical protein n=1 Tax=Pseudomonas asiatica TaxID=2219225 RepID=UPI002367BB95|nr:hypothetical protein [Pseudomonas asiatica]WDM89991.1 hypothetical protein LG197_07940 [Pseudomonas asiatica]
MPANTGEAGAMYRVVFFAGEPAPTGIAVTFSFAQYLWEQLSLEIYFQACHSGRASLDTA